MRSRACFDPSRRQESFCELCQPCIRLFQPLKTAGSVALLLLVDRFQQPFGYVWQFRRAPLRLPPLLPSCLELNAHGPMVRGMRVGYTINPFRKRDVVDVPERFDWRNHHIQSLFPVLQASVSHTTGTLPCKVRLFHHAVPQIFLETFPSVQGGSSWVPSSRRG